jgi:hypothetical protein
MYGINDLIPFISLSTYDSESNDYAKTSPSLPTTILLRTGDRIKSVVLLNPIPSLIEGGEENCYRSCNRYCLP